MSSVDDRIVNMKFNNSQFSQGVDKSKRDLAGLEKTITSAGRGKGMTSLGASVGAVSTKFSALQVAGVAALGTIVAKATSAGLSLLKSFTIQPILDGFKEYQTGLTSVQTIMSNTGKSVKAVNSALDQLNTYADKTIYNFGEMAKNVGTFTAAGVDLDTSVQSIKGIANLAAMSGSTSQQASTAMYQLSQAISAGKVGLQDWNSVVNAGMGGKVFQTALTRTAVNMGELAEGAIKLEGPLKKLTVNGESFRQSISAAAGQESYLTGEVLVDTLKQISGGYTIAELRAKGFSEQAAKDIDKLARDAFDAATQIKTFPQLIGVIRESIGSTFASAFRTIIGDFTQSKKLWGDVGYAIIGPHGFLTRIQDGFTDTLKGWAEGRGRDKVLKGFKRLFYGLTSVVGAFTGAFTDIFPPATSNTLVNLSSAFKRFALNLRPSKDTLEDLRSIFGGVFSIFHVGYSIVKAVATLFGTFFGALFDGSEAGRGGILSLLASVGELLIAFDAWLTKGDRLSNFMGKFGTMLGAIFAPVLAVVGLVIKAFSALASGEGIGAVAEPIDMITDKFLGFIDGLLGGLARITAPFESLSGFFESLQDKIGGMSGSFESAIAPLIGATASLGGLDGISGVFDKIINGAKTVGQAVKDAFNDVGAAMDAVTAAGENASEKLSGGFSAVESAAGKVKDATSGVYDSLGSGASAAAAGTDAVAARAENVGSVFGTIGGVIKSIATGIGDALGWMIEKMSNISFPDDALEWASVLNALLGAALIKRLFFSKGLFDSLQDTIAGVGDTVEKSFGQLTSTLKTMQTSIRAEMIKNIAIAVALLAASLLVLSFIPMDKLKVGLSAISGTFAILAIMLLALSKIDASMKIGVVAAGLVLIAGAVLLLTAAVAALGYLPIDVIEQGIESLAKVLAILTISVLAMSGIGAKIAAAGAAMVLMATAITILVAAVAVLGSLNPETLAQGLEGLAKALAIMTISLMALSGNSAKILAAGAAMVLMATALDIIVIAITALGLLPWDVVQQGLEAVAWGMGIMVVALAALSGIGPSVLAGGAAMIMMAVALNMLMTVILALGSAPWENVKHGLMAMGIGLGILLVAALLAAAPPVLAGLSALTAIIAAIGIALLAAGAGFFLFASGVALLAVAGTAAIGVIVAAIAAFILLLPQIALQMAAAFVTFIQAIALAAPKIRKAFGTIFKEMLGTISDALPEIGKLMSKLIETGLNVLVASASAFAEAGYQLIDNLLNSMEKHIPNIVDSAVSLVTEFLEEIGAQASELANAGLDMVVDVLNGISDAVENSDRVRDAAANLARTFVDELRETLADLIGNIDISSMIPDISLPSVDLPGNWPGGNDDKDSKVAANDKPATKQDLLDAAAESRRGDKDGKDGKDKAKDKAEKAKQKEINQLSKAIIATSDTLSTALDGAVRFLTASMSGLAYELALNSKALQARATRQSVTADLRGVAAGIAAEGAEDQMSRAEGMKGKAKFKKGKPKNKKAKALVKARKAAQRAEQQQKSADRMAEQAAVAQEKADLEAQKARDEVAFNAADAQGKGDIRSQQAQDLADRSNELQATAEAKANEAKRLEELAKKGGKNAKKYLQQAQQLRKEAAAETAEAMSLATQSIEAQAAAVAAYAEARKLAALDAIASMSAIREQQKAAQEQRDWENQYEAAKDISEDPAEVTKKTMLEARIADNDAKAKAAQILLDEALARSDALAATIARGETVSDAQLAQAEADLQAAEKLAQEVARAQDQIEDDKDTVAAIVKKAEEEAAQAAQEEARNNTTNGGTGTTGTTINPSRTALEDAAKAVDRYTSSVAQAEEMAGAGASTTQFVQNNYSPEALPASTIYRQAKNLVSAAEVKMGANN